MPYQYAGGIAYDDKHGLHYIQEVQPMVNGN